MKLALASDLHNEFYDVSPTLNIVDADVLVLAGDIETVKSHDDKWWDDTAKHYSKVIYIRGNHEDYGTYHTERPDLWFPDNVTVVGTYPKITNLEGKLTLAGTMWTDLSNPIDHHLAKTSMNDYRKIKHSRSRYWFTPDDTTSAWTTFKSLLDDYLPHIVISHHLPSYGSVPGEFQNDRLNAAYATEMDIEGVKLWMHGHTHTPCDYIKQGCRVVCNPRGYPGQNFDSVMDYKPKVIEI